MKPLIFFIDDEPMNLTVFEAAMPETWEIKTYSNPLEALEQLSIHNPCVIVSDQRMPGTTGVKFLELAMKICPKAIRIIATGYSEEELVVESVRKAKIFDYIKKPWEPEELVSSIERAISYFQVVKEREELYEKLLAREKELEEKNRKLEQSHIRESNIRKELECWVPPFLREALEKNALNFPIQKDLIGITFDIVKSSELHQHQFEGVGIRSHIIRAFSEAILKNGGWRESLSGDSAYGHFGLMENSVSPAESALATAREFRTALKNISTKSGNSFECGIALHLLQKSVIDVHVTEIITKGATLSQKTFDTSSSSIDLLHRIEKLTHVLPGSNIVMSEPFLEALKSPPANLVEAGSFLLPGQTQEVKLFILASEKLKDKSSLEIQELLKTTKTQWKTAA